MKREDLKLGDIIYVDYDGKITDKKESAAKVILDERVEDTFGGKKYYVLRGSQDKWLGLGKWSITLTPK